MATLPSEVAERNVLGEGEERRLMHFLGQMREEPGYGDGESSEKLEKAERLYREGKVECVGGLVYRVIGDTAGEVYTIDPTCSCKYSRGSAERWCSHRLAAALHRKVHAPLRQEETAWQDHKGTEGPASPRSAPEPVKVPSALPSLPRRSIAAILADLSRPLPPECIGQIPATYNAVTGRQRPAQDYLHWHTVAAVLDTYAPGWEGRIVRIMKLGTEGKEQLAIVYRLTLHAAEGSFSQDGDGMEAEDKDDYGDAMNSATATGLKRAAAKFGVGRYLYDKDGKTAAFLSALRKEKEAALKELATVADRAGYRRKAVLAWLCRQAGVFRASDIPTHMLRALTRQLEAGEPMSTSATDHGTTPGPREMDVTLDTLTKESEHIDRETGEILRTWERTPSHTP